MKHWVKIILELTKFRIALFAALSTSVGFILAKQGLSSEMMTAVSGVFFLACGSCALNQYQEREKDRLMERTRARPIPSLRLNPTSALKIALSLLSLGALILHQGTNGIAFGLGVLAIFWYNGLYTFLKRKTVFAVIPGALVGAIPPLLGWISGGGDLLDPQILAVAFFFFIWQIPHFWLLLLRFGKDYENAGFPSVTRIFTTAQLRRITFTWVFATAVACLMIPLFGLVTSYSVRVGFLVAGFWLVWKGFTLLRSHHSEFSLRLTFNSINAYVLLVMFLLTLDHLL
jgi:protoheme IX farnesyltransferase